MNHQKLRITELFEQLENAYKKYGNIAVAIRVDINTVVPVLQTGISEMKEGQVGIDNFYFCFSPGIEQESLDSTSTSTSTSS